MIPSLSSSSFQKLSNDSTRQTESTRLSHVQAWIARSLAEDEHGMFTASGGTLHHAKARILKALGLDRVKPVNDIGLDDKNHPFQKLREAHAEDSGFWLFTRRLDKLYDRFRLSCTEFIHSYEELKDFINRPFNPLNTNPVGNLAPRSFSSAEMFMVWLLRADNIDVNAVALIFGDVDRATIDRSFDHVTRAINDGYKNELDWPDAEA